MAAVATGAPSAPHASEHANLLSPSQVACFTGCSARWWFRYGLKLKDPKNGNLALGIAVHEAIGGFFALQLEGLHLEPGDVADGFSAAWRAQLDDAVLRDEDNPAELEATGRVLVSRYIAEVAPSIRPAAVEELVEGTIAGVQVQGKVDIRETDGTLRDIKTACRRPSGVSAGHAFQLATYAQLQPAASGRAVVDTLVKTKQPQLIQLETTVDACAIAQTRRMYPLVQEAMRAGLYVPNRDSNLCSRGNCPFWRACEAEYGGRVSA